MQLLMTLVVVSVAFAYLARAAYREWFGTTPAGCGSGCGKCSAAAAAPPPAPGRLSLPMAGD